MANHYQFVECCVWLWFFNLVLDQSCALMYSTKNVSISRSLYPLCIWLVLSWSIMSMKFPRQECWSGVPFTTPGDLPDPGNKSESLAPPVLPAGFFTPEPPGSPSHSTPGPVQGGECCFCGFSLSAQATAVSTSHIPEKEVNMLLWETSKKTKCALIFLNTILVEKGDKKKQR